MSESKPVWGASWLLPEEYKAAWGARAIADKHYKNGRWGGMHVASLLGDRQSAVGDWDELQKWINANVLPITMYYDGSSTQVAEVNDGRFHARWTPNGSFGYIYIVAWEDK